MPGNPAQITHNLLQDLRPSWLPDGSGIPDLRDETWPHEVEVKVKNLAWQIADDLREADDVPHLDEIITILMKEDAYATANDRAIALDDLISRLGDKVNPRYMRAIREASSANLHGFLNRPPGHRNNSPGNMGM